MESITTSQFDELLEKSHPACVSLYLPTDPTNADPRINKTAFKNSINKMISQMKSLKMTDDTYKTLDKVCEELVDDDIFWKQQDQSFALFAAGDWVKTYKLPSPEYELSMLSDHFYLVPFIPLLNDQTTYFVLELDKEHTQMWRGRAEEIHHVTVPDLPKSIAEVTGVETGERHLQFHTGSDAPKGDTRSAIFHGNSSWKDDKDRYLERFLKAVDKAVLQYLKNTRHPLLLSGVEEAVVMYRKLSKYPAIYEKSLPKVDNPNLRMEILSKQAGEALEMVFEAQRATAVTAYEEQPRLERKVTILPEILRQATQGKVESLLLAEDTRVWGTFDPLTFTAVVADVQQPMSCELLNLAARLTLQAGGAVSVLPQEQMPESLTATALLRY